TGQISPFTLKMAVASKNTSVTDTTEAPILDVSDSRLQTTVNTKQLQDLPVAGRNFFNLVAVAPGITGHGAVGGGAPADAPDNFGTENTVDASSNGRNYSGNQFTLDGVK